MGTNCVPQQTFDHKKTLLDEAINTRELPDIKRPIENEAEHILEDLNKTIDELHDCEEKSCAYCSKEKRVEDMSCLQRGQHISVNGYHYTKYFKSLNKQVPIYRHHAIIKEVTARSRRKAKVVCIHFTEDPEQTKEKKDPKIKVLEQECSYNLQNDELYIILYQHPRYTPDVIVQNAESILRQSKDEKLFKNYNFLLQNCEHFATWCVVGEKQCFQSSELLHNFLSTLLGVGNKLTRIIIRALYSYSDEIASTLAASSTVTNCVLGGILVLHVVYCIIKSVYLINQYMREKIICKSCFRMNLFELWGQCGTFAGTTLVSLLITYFVVPLLVPCLGITISVVIGLLGAALSLAVPKIRKALQSPFKCDKKEIITLSELKLGDIVSLRINRLRSLILVSKVEFKRSLKQGTVDGIYYSLTGLSSRMVIVEETKIKVDLTKSKVMVLQLKGLHTLPGDLVVARARKRIGERKWRASSNRSDHFFYWAMINSEQSSTEKEWSANKENGQLSKSLSSLFVGESDVHLIDEILLGDIVEYGSEKGIVVGLVDESKGRIFNVDIIVHKGFFKPYIRLVSHKIDLDMNNLKVYKYHHAHCVSREERVKRALDMRDKASDCWTQLGFIADILKDQSGY